MNPHARQDRRHVADNGGVRKFTWKELSELNKRHNAHVAYRGKVYDVSSFVSRHPGGVDQILMGAGRDVTHILETYHKHDTPTKVLDKYYVGELVDNEHPVFPVQGEFSRTLKARVEKYMKDHNLVWQDPKVDYFEFFREAVLIAVVFLSWYAAITFQSNLLLCLLFTCVWGFSSALVFMSIFHITAHFSITHKPWVWKVIITLSESIIGVSSYCLYYQHIFGHHPYTNIFQWDPDIYIPSDEVRYVWKLKTSQKWFGSYVYQHLYMPFMYTMLCVRLRLLEAYEFSALKKANIRMNPLTFSQWATYCIGRISHVAMRLVFPFFFMSIGKLVLMNIVYEIICGYWFGQVTQVTHVTQEVDWPQPDKDNLIHTDWYEMQVRTSRDFCTESWIWYLLSGGANYQTAHHLFPSILQSHHRWITPIVKQTCEEFGIKYNCTDSFLDAVRQNYEFLKNRGSRKQD